MQRGLGLHLGGQQELGYYDEWCPGLLLLELLKYCGDKGVTEPKAG